MTIDLSSRERLLELAVISIEHGLTHCRPLPVVPSEFPAPLREPRACFVTLESQGVLRGCTGVLEARKPLVRHVAECAYGTAFEDPRFPPLEAFELERLAIELSVLGLPEPLAARSEAELYASLRPGIDGLILTEGAHQATFLPQVWKQLPEPADFLARLRLKAGLRADYWSPTLSFQRYATESFGGLAAAYRRSVGGD
jgi:AmmeMemoRadiSam system protein A